MHEDGGIVSEVPFDEESSGAVLKVVEEDLEMNNKMEEARLKSLNRLEQSSVDLPVRAIETVLDREITPEDYYGARYLGSLPCSSNANVADEDANVQPFVDADNHELNDIDFQSGEPDSQLQDTTDVETQERTRRIPWFAPLGSVSTKRSGVTIVQSDDNVLEMHPADQSRFALANKLSFVFPKVKSRRIKIGLVVAKVYPFQRAAFVATAT